MGRTKTKLNSKKNAKPKPKEDKSYNEDVDSREEDYQISVEEVGDQPPLKKQKVERYIFNDNDVPIIEEAIATYGLNYKTIWEKHYHNKTSLNQLKSILT
jgi:hypothetical protein